MDQGDLVKRVSALEASVRRMEASLARTGRQLSQESVHLHAGLYRAIESLLAVHRYLDRSSVLPPLADPYSGWAISSDMARLLCELFVQYRPSVIVELGSGSSTALFGHLIRQFGGTRLVAVEHDAVWYAQTLEQLHLIGLTDIVELRYAPLESLEFDTERFRWYSLEALEDVMDIDLVFVDGPPGHIQPLARYPAGPVIAPKCSTGCLFVVDDIVREDEREMVERWSKETQLVPLEEHLWLQKGALVMRLMETEVAGGD